MTRLRDYIEKQRAAIAAQGEPLLERRKILRKEIEEIDAKLKVLDAEWIDLGKAADALGVNEVAKPTEERKSEVTIKDAVLMVLADHPKGMTAAEILKTINIKFFNGEVERTSFSPQLSRLKNNDGKIVQKGALYFLAAKKEEGPATAEPSYLE